MRLLGLSVLSLKPYGKLLAVLLSVALIGGALAFGGVAAVDQTSDGDQQQTTYLKVVHASPDAPPVDVMVENETVLSDVPFGAVSDYLALDAGTYNVTIAAAEDSETVLFDGEVTLEPGSVTTLAASGEVSEDAESAFELVAYGDTASTPADNESALRVIHLSPDAPPVDITAPGGNVVLVDGLSFQNASDYVTVPEGNYTLEIRAATENGNGPILTTVNMSLNGGTAYSAMAVGYQNPDEAPADTEFEVILTEDATSGTNGTNGTNETNETTSVQLASDESGEGE